MENEKHREENNCNENLYSYEKKRTTRGAGDDPNTLETYIR